MSDMFTTCEVCGESRFSKFPSCHANAAHFKIADLKFELEKVKAERDAERGDNHLLAETRRELSAGYDQVSANLALKDRQLAIAREALAEMADKCPPCMCMDGHAIAKHALAALDKESP